MNSETPTPETDAATLTVEQRLRYLNGNSLCDMVRADFARWLERERDEARAIADDLSSYLEACMPDVPMGTSKALKRYAAQRYVMARKGGAA